MGADTSTRKTCKDKWCKTRGEEASTKQCRLYRLVSTERSELGHGVSLMGDSVGPGGLGVAKTRAGGFGGPLHRPSLTVRQGLTAFEADLEPEGAVERARVLQHSYIQHRHLGHHLAREPQLLWSLLQ